MPFRWKPLCSYRYDSLSEHTINTLSLRCSLEIMTYSCPFIPFVVVVIEVENHLWDGQQHGHFGGCSREKMRGSQQPSSL
jgi:hypothetical protein